MTYDLKQQTTQGQLQWGGRRGQHGDLSPGLDPGKADAPPPTVAPQDWGPRPSGTPASRLSVPGLTSQPSFPSQLLANGDSSDGSHTRVPATLGGNLD